MEQAVAILHTQNQLLAHHPNANLYSHLAQFVELDGYYLESEPCLVCNNPEVALSSIKLSSIKVFANMYLFKSTPQASIAVFHHQDL
jgi:E3 ubiquitin-protein ligase UBR4